MGDGYRRLCPTEMEKRDDEIIKLLKHGIRHKYIAQRVRMQPGGLEMRLKKLRQEGKITAGGRNGDQRTV